MPNIDPNLGYKVTTRQFSLEEMVSREWGSEFRAPDHAIYVFDNRRFDSTDTGYTGIYRRPGPVIGPIPPIPPIPPVGGVMGPFAKGLFAPDFFSTGFFTNG